MIPVELLHWNKQIIPCQCLVDPIQVQKPDLVIRTDQVPDYT